MNDLAMRKGKYPKNEWQYERFSKQNNLITMVWKVEYDQGMDAWMGVCVYICKYVYMYVYRGICIHRCMHLCLFGPEKGAIIQRYLHPYVQTDKHTSTYHSFAFTLKKIFHSPLQQNVRLDQVIQ